MNIRRVAPYVATMLGQLVLTVVLEALRDLATSTVILLAYLTVVLCTAAAWGTWPALVAVFMGALAFDYFFTYPYYDFAIDKSEDWIALGAFLVAAITTGAVHGRARRRTAEAEAGRSEVERLFVEIGAENTRRKQAEEQVRLLNAELEQRVRQRTAELETVNKELEAFCYSVSHDLRAPLRHVSGFAELLQKHAGSAVDEKGRRYLSVITDSTRQMDQLINDLLSFSRTGRGEVVRARVDLAQLVREAIAELTPDTRGRAVQWQLGPLPVAHGDRAMLKLVFLNLLGNALKFTGPRESPVVEVGALNTAANDHTVFVRDNGVGFDMRYIDKLFGVFQRLHGTGEFEGTGIGLATVRRIIHRHGGQTWAEGRVNEGATFYFSLPKTKDGVSHGQPHAHSPG
jgi:K+-sensing histidine kinase KdpD